MVAGEIDWANLTVAGAFAIGALAGTWATVHIVRSVSAVLTPVARRRRPPRPDQEADDDV